MSARWVAFAALLLAGCGSARRSEPVVGPIAFSPEAQRGQQVFMAYCNNCHPQGEGGVGPAINNKPLPAGMIKLQVRKGFGAMPAFGADKIPDADLDALAVYLLELRRAK